MIKVFDSNYVRALRLPQINAAAFNPAEGKVVRGFELFDFGEKGLF